MADDPKTPEKKIIVDEDWKSQVEAEREAILHPAKTPPAEAKLDEEPLAEDSATQPPLPPPSLSYLASSIYLQAAISLGIFPHPVAGKSDVHLAQAKHSIETLDILQQKTEGNRTVDETEEIDAMLHQLRLVYIEVARKLSAGK